MIAGQPPSGCRSAPAARARPTAGSGRRGPRFPRSCSPATRVAARHFPLTEAAAVAKVAALDADHRKILTIISNGPWLTLRPPTGPFTNPRHPSSPPERSACVRLRILLELAPRGHATPRSSPLAQAAEAGRVRRVLPRLRPLPRRSTRDDVTYQPTDSWTTLVGLAVQTDQVRLGTLVTASTFRLPGQLAVEVATVAQMSGGRAELGIGAAWYEREHQYFGIPFPGLGERGSTGSKSSSRSSPVCGTPSRGAVQLRGQALPAHRLRLHPRAGRAAEDHRRRGRIEAPGCPTLAARYADEFNGALGLDLRERYANFRRICAGRRRPRPGRGPPASATVPTLHRPRRWADLGAPPGHLSASPAPASSRLASPKLRGRPDPGHRGSSVEARAPIPSTCTSTAPATSPTSSCSASRSSAASPSRRW